MEELLNQLRALDDQIEVNTKYILNLKVMTDIFYDGKYESIRPNLQKFMFEKIVQPLGKPFVEFSKNDSIQNQIRESLIKKHDYNNKKFQNKQEKELFMQTIKFEQKVLLIMEFLNEEKKKLEDQRKSIEENIEKERAFILRHVLKYREPGDNEDDDYDVDMDNSNQVPKKSIINSLRNIYSNKFESSFTSKDQPPVSQNGYESDWSTSALVRNTTTK